MTSRSLVSPEEPAARPGGRIRRRVEAALERGARGFLGLWLFAVAWIAVSFVIPPRDYLRAADWQLDAGPVESYEIGVPRMLASGPEPVWVVRRDPRSFTALAAVCQHQHCVLHWSPALGAFSCPCHRGTYDLGGSVSSGPSRQALPTFFVNVKAGRVRVHLRRAVEEEA